MADVVGDNVFDKPKKASATNPPPRKRGFSVQGEWDEALQGYVQMAGMGLLIAGQHADSAAIGMHGPNVVNELCKLGEKNQSVGRVLDYLTAAGPFAGLIGAVLPLALQIAANHKVVPIIPQLGIIPPDALEAQAKMEVAEMMAQAQEQQRQAEEQLRKLQEDLLAEEEPSTD